MFTGLVAARGTLVETLPLAAGLRLRLSHPLGALELGESIAVSGVCLTVTSFGDDWFTADVSPETLARTTLGQLRAGDAVNLERALRAGDRLGGHLVSGHVDGVGTIVAVKDVGDMTEVRLEAGPELRRFLAQKGSVTIDGVSLTINDVSGSQISLLLVPHTQSVTTLSALKAGQRVNVEVDQIARYVDQLLAARS